MIPKKKKNDRIQKFTNLYTSFRDQPERLLYPLYIFLFREGRIMYFLFNKNNCFTRNKHINKALLYFIL